MNKYLRNLYMFEADNGANGSGNGENSSSNNQDGGSSDGSQNTDKTIPYSRFKEVNDNYKSVKEQLDKLMKDKEQADEEAKKQQGEYQALYGDIKPKYDSLEQQFKQYEVVFKDMLKNKMESVPEEFKDLIPNGSDLEKLSWIDNAQTKGLFKKETVTDFGNRGSNPNDTKVEPKNLLEALQNKLKK